MDYSVTAVDCGGAAVIILDIIVIVVAVIGEEVFCDGAKVFVDQYDTLSVPLLNAIHDVVVVSCWLL